MQTIFYEVVCGSRRCWDKVERRKISHGFGFEARLELLEYSTIGTSKVSRGACLREELPE